MKSIAVLQARTTSSRLPGKVLLPIGGLPLVVLAAKRASNSGCDIIMATSREKSDDELVATAVRHGIKYFRGSLDDTLGRVAGALKDFDDDDVMFRLTADNVFPDGGLLEDVQRDFLGRRVEYLACNGSPSGVPYGMSVEITRVRHIRAAAKEATSPYDREHVTPFVIRRYGQHYFQHAHMVQRSDLRCTIDYPEDYNRVAEVFRRVADPIRTPASKLVGVLDEICAAERRSLA